jgi:hypothetical protein
MSEELVQTRAALDAQTQRVQALETRMLNDAKDGAIGRAIAEHPLVPGSAKQLAKLLADEVQAVRNGEEIVVTGPALTPLADHIKTRLASAEFGHFLQPKRAGEAAATTQAAPTSRALLEGESLSQYVLRQHASDTGRASIDPRAHPAMFLRGIRPK